MELSEQEYLIELGKKIGVKVRIRNRNAQLGVAYETTWTSDVGRAFTDLHGIHASVQIPTRYPGEAF